jgi:glucose/arabinose dehydrogenase
VKLGLLGVLFACLSGAVAAAADKPVLTGTYNNVPQMPSRNSSGFPDPRRVEGQPVETRNPEKLSDAPAFPGQTRAPYRKSVSFRTTMVAEGLKLPYSMAFLSGGRVLVTEKGGTLRIVDPSGAVSAPISGVPAVVFSGQQGLLDVALDKNYARNRRIFLSYTARVDVDDQQLVLASARLDEAALSLTDVKPIFKALPVLPKTLPGIQGGRIAIDPNDGSVFLTVGDHSRSPPWRIAQDLSSHLGKIVRLTPEGRPHPANPFLKTKDALPEIWSYGHRSEQGLAFDASGRLWENEHGARGGDELNLIRRAANYGWPLIAHGIDYPGFPFNEGRTGAPGLTEPRYYWDPVIAPSGLAFYKGDLFPAWRGSAFIGGLRSNQLLRVKLAGDKVVEEEPLISGMGVRVRDVRVGPDGAVYYFTDDGKLWKLTPA